VPPGDDDSSLPTSRLGRLWRLGKLGTRAGVGRLAAAVGAGGGDGAAEAAIARSAADALGSMRGLALKLGQMASYVDGLVPEEHRALYETTLRGLRDAAPAMSPDAAARVLEAELGAPPGALFAEFSPEPFAAASIGQVHRARLADGRAVAVKIQYDGVDRAVTADLANASLFGALLGPIGSKFGAKEQLAEARARFLEELDYANEARAQERFRARFAGDAAIRVPAVVADRSSRRVLTSELAAGLRLEDAAARAPEERVAWARSLWRFVFDSLVVDGDFNADPHPGNYLFVDGDAAPGTIWFLDYGCTRPLPRERLRWDRILHRAALAGDERAFYEAAHELLSVPRGGPQGPLLRAYIRLAFEPLFAGGPHHVTHAYCRRLMDDMRTYAGAMLRGSRKDWVPMPPELLFFNRLQLGFYSILARLDVTVDYHALETKLIERVPR